MGLLGDITNALGKAAGVMSPLGTIAGGVSALGSLFGTSSEDKAMALAEKQHLWDVEENARNRQFQKDEWTRQFNAINAYNDPKATKERLSSAGLNGSALLSGQGAAIGQSTGSPSAPSGASGLNPMPDVVSQVGFQSQESLFKRLSMLGDLSKNAALLPATKAKLNAEIENILNDTKYKDIRTKSEEFMLSLDKILKPYERNAGLMQALKSLAVADADIRLKGSQSSEADARAAQLAEEKLLTIAKRNLSQKDFERLELEIKWYDKMRSQDIRESKSREVANYGSANQSNTQASVNKELRRYHSAIADFEETTKSDKIKTFINECKAKRQISDADAEEALLRLSRIQQIEDKRSTDFFKEVDGFTEWLKSKISIFK